MTGPSPRRVILGATCYEDARHALRIALAVASQVRGELLGLLVEEEAILRLAEMPSARLFSREGGALARPGAQRMRAAFQSDAARFERSLAEAAGAQALSWRFSLRRGRLGVVLSEEAASGDLILLGGEPMFTTPGEVVLVSGADGDDELAGLASSLAGAFHSRLTVLRSGAGTGRPAGLTQPATVETFAEADRLAARLGRLGADSLLVADLDPAPTAIDRLIEHARCTRLLRRRAPANR